MATTFKRTLVRQYPQSGEKITTDTLYWKNLEVPVTKKEYGAITHIDFCPVEPHYFAVTNSTRVQVYSPISLQILKSISRFKEVTYSGSFRNDGKLLVAGGDEGIIRLFDVSGKTLLRVFKGHQRPVHVTKFLMDRLHLFSGADDNSVRVWDIPTEKEVVVYEENKDYVRSGIASCASQDIILTGSYDHTVKLFDTRISESVMTVDHGHPVESVLMFPSGGIFLSAGGNVVKVWDALSGGKLLTTLCHHHKTVTCLTFCSNYQRFMSGGLDRHVKIYDVSSYQVVHTLDYPGAVISLGSAPDDSLVVVGTAEGLLSIQKRKPDGEPVKMKKKPVSFRYALKGKTYIPNKGDHVVEHKRREHLAKYDKYFKRFEHSKALDAALSPINRRTKPEIPMSVLQELIRRSGIRAALAGYSETQQTIIIKFIQRNISNPNYLPVLLDVANLVLDLYSDQLGQSSMVDKAVQELKEAVDMEVKYMKTLYEMIGMMDTLFSASAHTDQSLLNGQASPVNLTPSAAAQNT
ncbi:hypothetical protein CHS0354_025093 [Potamilus streckersoni]|uniref:U3 small nucleolar RNA-associated protein 15 homolog n=1 Tax=Potamilus streckersoni TaxID=2493646 RepID=A0AAE0W8J2_9BIVA|nr:hypothetical protein CHS0354_025093 [Potamilus streckersoni]